MRAFKVMEASIDRPIPEIDGIVLDTNDVIEANQYSHALTAHLSDEKLVRLIEAMAHRMMKVSRHIFDIEEHASEIVISKWRTYLSQLKRWLLDHVPTQSLNTVYRNGVYYDKSFKIIAQTGKDTYVVMQPMARMEHVSKEALAEIISPGRLVNADTSLGKPSGVILHPMFTSAGYDLGIVVRNIPSHVIEKNFPEDKRWKAFSAWKEELSREHGGLGKMYANKRVTSNYIRDFNATFLAVNSKKEGVIAAITAGQSPEKGAEGAHINEIRKETLSRFVT